MSLIFFLFLDCDKKEDDMVDDDPQMTDDDPGSEYALGWFGNDDMSTIPTSTNFGFGNISSTSNSADLSGYFPPIGDQNPYGTCVSWAVGYYGKTATSAIKNGWSGQQLQQPSFQASPKDLFFAIPNSRKGLDCNGTNFVTALETLQQRGVASMQTVPYTDLNFNCSQGRLQSSWTSEAGQNRIDYWRRIDPNVSSIKQNIDNNVPVVFGAALPENFPYINSSSVLTAGSAGLQGRDALHAMAIVGYDDSRGPNGAFRVINSWGTFWGDNGFVWIDYNYFFDGFCIPINGGYPLFIMAEQSGNTPPNGGGNTPSNGVDMAPWVFGDISRFPTTGNPLQRSLAYDVYNIGNQTATSNNNWSIYYIYFNAYNANDYNVIFVDTLTDQLPAGTFSCNSNFSSCGINVDIAPGSSFASTFLGTDGTTREYFMPQITGLYYLVLIADAEDRFQERDELNNLFYTTQAPKYFEFGYSTKGSKEQFTFENKIPFSPEALKDNPFQTIVNNDYPNAYTSAEVLDLLKREKSNGNLDKKIQAYKNNQNNTSNPFKLKK